jgi:DNA relaxase NicK
VECTTRSSEPVRSRIVRTAKQARKYSLGLAGRSSTTTISCTDGGATIYLGKRTSEKCGRIYDKYAESGDSYYLNSLRHEVEFKGDAAKIVSQTIYGSDFESPALASCLQGFFSDRIGSLTWLDDNCTTIVVPRARPSIDSRLRWLRESVRPSIRDLVGVGMGQAVLDSLGITINPDGTLALSHES